MEIKDYGPSMQMKVLGRASLPAPASTPPGKAVVTQYVYVTQEHEGMKADEDIYETVDGRVVGADDPAALSLVARKGMEIPPKTAARLSITRTPATEHTVAAADVAESAAESDAPAIGIEAHSIQALKVETKKPTKKAKK